jgi:PAS domain S-box-containing protein
LFDDHGGWWGLDQGSVTAAQLDGLLALATAELPAAELLAHAAALRAGSTDREFQDRVTAVVDAAVARREREDALARSVRHFVAAQRISHVGSYDFDIGSDTNDWSDQLYRIYGREPQSFNASYEKFLEMVHPDDREMIIGVHQTALASLSPYEMEEQVVWPNGDVRTLASWGEVVAGPDGTPTRMVGICWDITEQKETAAALARSSERFQRLIESAPDVVLVVSPVGTVVHVNDRVQTVLGWDPGDVIGQPVTMLLPDGLGPGGPPRELVACDRDGNEIPAEVSTSEIETEDGQVTAAFVRDLRDRKRSEDFALRLHDADVRRRHALEINDNVVQGLASVLYLLDLDRYQSAHGAARRTMATARAMMDDLLEGAGQAALSPGELVRGQGHIATLTEVVPPQPPAVAGALRVVLADDAEDIRLLLRLSLTTSDGFEVVGEAGDGEQAALLAAEHQPDVILLDLSMPVMDGLQAIPEIRRVSPGTRIVVLSGFDGARMKPVALELGADAYLEKGEAMADLVATLGQLFPDHPVSHPISQPRDLDEREGGLTFDGDMVVHELRTPLTVITGMLATLRDRMDTLPSATTHELLDAAGRNARQMAELLDAVSDARRAAHGLLPVVPEQTDLARLVRDAVADVVAGHGLPMPIIRTDDSVEAAVDPMRIRQVISNLLSNAFKFSPPSTPVTVTVSSHDDVAEITVHDAGPGIPEDRRDELFSKFSRLGHTGHGMGLGLYISRAIARAHNGELELRDGPGATFVLTLPLHQTVHQHVESNGI